MNSRTLTPTDEAGCDNQASAVLRKIPSVDEVLARPVLRGLESRLGHQLLLESAREVLQDLRRRILSGQADESSFSSLEAEIAAASEAKAQPSLVSLINATGVILHTNLGRAPLAAEAIQHLAEIASGYSNLEYDLESGERGKRDMHTERLFAQLVGAETTLVVNNNAAAVFLALNTLAHDGEVVVSRGELIEIGGSFRIPDICSKSGAILREVGTTNRTRASDYAAAVNERTRVLLRVHPSNFRIVGFTERPPLEEMVALARKHDLILMEDLGSGCLVDLAPKGMTDEPTVGPSLRSGVDVVTFSGDKLLGGPQAGILTGKRQPLECIRRNPLFRALRVDKLTVAALEATVSLYLRGKLDAIPVLRMIHATVDEIAGRAARLGQCIAACHGFSTELRKGESVLGGGSTPGQSLPTRLVAVTHQQHSPQALERLLRANRPPVIVRVEHDRVLLDLRTVFDHQEEKIIQAFERIADREAPS